LIKGEGFEGWAASNWLEPVQSGGQCRPREYPLFKQCDSRWGSDKLGSSSTVCKVGCLITSVAMALNGLGKRIDGNIPDPKNFNQFLMTNGGYQGNLFLWYSVSKFGFQFVGMPTDVNVIKKYVCDKYVVSINIDRGGHWVLAIGINADGSFQILDPGFNRNVVPANEVLRAGIYKV
jgi:hypothetical protein